jgi:hypothetical protein
MGVAPTLRIPKSSLSILSASLLRGGPDKPVRRQFNGAGPTDWHGKVARGNRRFT